MARRKVVQIDESKCDGCGLCIPACAEGALQIVQGKARLVADVYCDGLGACLGECPQGAITVVEREAEPFDEQAARRRAAGLAADRAPAGEEAKRSPAACPGATGRGLQLDLIGPQPHQAPSPDERGSAEGPPAAGSSRLGNWPVQLHLVSPDAPFLKDADLLLVADCVPFALADFHTRFLGKRPVVVGCPKLDDADLYVGKLARIVTAAEIHRITVVHMDVPCCTGLVRIAERALQGCGRSVPLEEVTISIRGKVLQPRPAPASRQ